jgi:antitoxin (DNA-binding transcriptional repressor) of toxin-antitoxin stability system
MTKTLTVSQAKAKLGQLLDKAGEGQSVFVRRKERLFRIEPVAEIEPIPNRPFGFFAIEADDPMVSLANSTPASFSPPR